MRAGFLIAPVLALVVGGLPNLGTAEPQVSGLVQRAYRAVYSLDFEEATALARQAVAADPEAARSHRALASVLWLRMAFARGAMTVDHYMGSVTKSQKTLPKVSPELDAEFQSELKRAMELADARLKQTPNDLDAQHDVGAAAALQASYISSVQGSLMAAYGPARRAFQIEEDILEKDPSRSSAAFVVGVYRYLVSTFSAPTRIFAYIVGFGGGKERGISLLEQAAAGNESHVEACGALLLVYTKEGRHKDALRIARRLVSEFPRNRLFVLEEGSAAARAGLGAEADAALTRGLTILAEDPRPRFPGEEAFWHYKRAIARTQMGHLADAEADLAVALSANPLDWVRGRIHLQMGRVADLNGKRPAAVAEYRQARSICEAENDPICADEAARLTKQAYTGK
jgi:tetratricopeptide (TPR) repeat protein